MDIFRTNKASVATIVIIIVIILIIIGGIYWSAFKKPEPKETFLDYRSEIKNIEEFDEIKSVNQKYLSQRIILKTQEYEQIELSEEAKNQIITMAKYAPLVSEEITDIREEITGDTTAKLYITLESNKMCIVPCVFEENRWKFEIVECKEAQHKLADKEEIKPTCGLVVENRILNVEGNRTDQETESLSCMKNALLKCSPASIEVKNMEKVIYRIEGRDNQHCNISRISNFITTCRVLLNYIKEVNERYRMTDIFVQNIIGSINAEGRQRDGFTGQIEILFECE